MKHTFNEHPKSIFWSNKNLISPDKLALNSHKKFWFNCDCGHDFECCLLNINQSNNWCPYCSNHPMKLCEKEECIMCFENSFASNEKSNYWSKDNELTPRQVFKSADKKNLNLIVINVNINLR